MGDDALTALETVQTRYLEVNGEHPLTTDDEAHIREYFTPATPEQLVAAANGQRPLPAYLLADGTPMMADIDDCLEAAGGDGQLHDWFVAFWPDDETTAAREWESFVAGHHVDLRHLNPIFIRNRNQLVAQAQTATQALRNDPRDELAQGALIEAVNGGVGVKGLDQILLPSIAYDRLRFGGPTDRDLWVDAVRAEFHSPGPPELPIHTERLTLRRTLPTDAQAMARAWADPEFSRYLLLPMQNFAEVQFTTLMRSKPPTDPHGELGLTLEFEGVAIGNVVLFTSGPGNGCMEIGWTLHPWMGGRGLATEAANEALRLAFEHYGARRVVANLDALNKPSAAMCERLGMRREVHRLADFWSKGRWTDSYEYAILRSEWEAR